uniref:Glycosyltransferase 61 catalytic domain-containing protein n=1 Tax=Davidia involucrata TaxID=16924 RepID=A0A5B6YGS4_DAVIN
MHTGEDRTQLEATGFACHSDLHTDVCVANKPVRIDTRTLTVYVPNDQITSHGKHTVQPYARKGDKTAMKFVSPVQSLHGNITPPACHYTHHAPALVFSSGGFTGNLFHEFNEVIIPLFITSRHFRSHLRFIITDFNPRLISKYNRILSHLSRFEVINPMANASVHCFPGAIIGLKYHNNLALNTSDIPGGYTMPDFKQFLRESYNLKLKNVSGMKKPVLILISRQKSRMFLNEDEMVGVIEELGFEVVVAMPNRMSNLNKFTEVLNSCSVMVGSHGAGLTNAVFLPAGAVMLQVVPLGLDWASTTYFGRPVHEMGVQYLEYKIEPEESSLFNLYGQDHPVIVDPASIFSKGYSAARAVYVDGQNLKINLVRFRQTLIKAIRLLGRSAPLS